MREGQSYLTFTTLALKSWFLSNDSRIVIGYQEGMLMVHLLKPIVTSILSEEQAASNRIVVVKV
jgi:hypothetical protein